MLDPLSPWPALVLTAIALAFAALLSRWAPPSSSHDRYLSIDGLRGYLAFFVFLHHTTVWYGYIRTGSWSLPDSHLYIHFGQSSVALFFMITGFLFWSKMLDAKDKPIDWLHLYVSRVFRLTPLYLVAMAIVFLVVAQASDFQLREPISSVLIDCFRWLIFTATGSPEINGMDNTYIVIAGVPWSLRYEWLFYVSLPILALALRILAPLPILALSALSIVICALLPLKAIHLAAFLGGILAAYVVRIPDACAVAKSPWASLFAAGCIVGAVLAYRGSETLGALGMLTVAFVLIACGSTLGGILTNRACRLLGDLSYSLYLLHGILLFVVFDRLIGLVQARQLTPLAHWAIAAASVPALICLALMTYKLIEIPGIAASRVALRVLHGFATRSPEADNQDRIR